MGQGPGGSLCFHLLLVADPGQSLTFPNLHCPICKRGMTHHGLVAGIFISFAKGFMTILTTWFVQERFKNGWKTVK